VRERADLRSILNVLGHAIAHFCQHDASAIASTRSGLVLEFFHWLLSHIDPKRIDTWVTGILIALIAWLANKAFHRLRRWWWARLAKNELLYLDSFEFQGVNANIKVLDALLGNVRTGYRDDLITCGTPETYISVETLLQTSSDELLSAMLPTFRDNRRRWLAVAQAGGKQIWDYNDLVGFNKITILRDGEDERSKIIIRTARSSYFDHRAIADCFKATNPSDHTAILRQHEYGSEVFGRLTAISCALITTDAKLIFPRRSRSLTSDPGMITCGVNEAIKISDVHQKGALSVPKRAILRGLDEEFGIVDVPQHLLDRVQVWALVLHTVPFEWYFYGTADFRNCGPDFTVRQLERNLLTGKARDKFENESISVVNFRMPQILRFVKHHRDEMTEYGASLPIMAALFDGQSHLSMSQRVRRAVSFGGKSNS
jgi:hypothetical protein